MDLIVKVKCKKVGLEKLLRFPRKETNEGLKFPEELGFVPPKGTIITFTDFSVPKWNGVYRVKKVSGRIDVIPGERIYEEEAEVKFLHIYEVELKKI